MLSKKNVIVLLLLIFFFFDLKDGFGQKKRDLRFLDPHKKLTQYTLDHWGTDEGLPSTSVRKLAQTHNGFLWFSSFDGLTRFDGVRFIIHSKKNIPELNNNSIYALCADKNEKLWIGTQGSGLFLYQNNRFRFVGLEGKWIQSIFIENENKIWIGVQDEGLYWYHPRSQKFTKVKNPLFTENSVYDIKRGMDNKIWVATQTQGLLQYHDKKWKQFSTQEGIPKARVLDIFFDKQHTLWIGTTKGLYQKVKNKFVHIQELKENIIHNIVADASGSLWLATSEGLYRRNILSSAYELYPISPDAPLTNVVDLLLDNEGSLWVATYRNGLYRIKDGKFMNYTYQEGLATPSVGSVCEYDAHTLLVGSNDGKINMIRNNQISDFPVKTTLPKIRVFNIMKDSKKNIWISTFKGLLKITAQKQEIFYDKSKGLVGNTIRVSYEDTQGNIWVGTRWNGVSCIKKNGKIKNYNIDSGLSSNFIMSINEDTQGNILIGTNDGGLNILQKNGEIKVHNQITGLVSNLVFNTHTDKEGVIWLVSNGGISRIKNGKTFNFTSRDGMPNDSPFDFVEDNFGHVWLPNSRGIMKVEKIELNEYAEGKITDINWTEFDKHDGMKSEDCTGATHSLKAKNGNIFVPTNGGLVAIDPKNMPRNHLPPKIQINSFLVDGKYLDIHQNDFSLAPNTQRIIFDYSALSLLASEKVRFKYKIIDFDEEWVEAGRERQAVYTSLPAGEHTFQVIACNNDGVWNMEGVKITFTIQPRFYETLWFWFLIIIVLAWLIYGIFRWRVYAIKKRNIELEKTVERRTREIRETNLALEVKNKEIKEQKDLLQKRNYDITNSINYAKRIQEAMLPTMQEIQTQLPSSFVFFRPRDIVSGDFYWFGQKNYKTIIATIDCTGHGVPGAFMSMIGNDLLNEIIFAGGITEADKILNNLHKGINRTLRQKETDNKDGMDLGICVIDQIPEKHKDLLPPAKLEFAGARNSLMYVRNNQLLELKGDRFSIGGSHKKIEEIIYTKHTLELDKNTSFYMFSDGYADQFGSDSRRKFGKRRLRELFLKIQGQDATTQKKMIARTLDKWKGSHFQVDDILVIGFKA